MENAYMKSILILLIIILLSNCSSPTEYTDKPISIEKLDDKLKITNYNNQTIYLFLVEQEIAALINWSPKFNGHLKIKKNNFLLIDFSDIYSGEKKLQNGDKIIVYYWDDSNKENPNVLNKIIQL